jgi:thimet oligopeptidase
MNTTRLIALCSLALICGSALAAPIERATVPLYDAQTLAKACTDALALAEGMVNALQAVPMKRVAATDMLGRWDRVRIATQDIEGPAGLFANVSPDEKTRAAAEDCEQKIERFDTALLQNERLYARIKATSPRGAAAIKMRKDILDAFEDTGVALPADKRARMSAILQRLEAIRQEFGRNIRNNKTRLTFTADEVKGLPPSYLDRAQRDEKGNFLLGFEYPEYLPFMANADNEDARRRYQFAYATRGTPRNIELLSEVIRLRREMAGLFGLSDYAHFATRRRMVGNPETVEKFLGEVKGAVREVERKELAELTAFKAELQNKKPAEVTLNRWDVDFYQDKLKKARYSIDQEALRKYFPTDASFKWVVAISSQLYGVRFVPVKVPVWHEDVQYFDVVDVSDRKSGDNSSGKVIGGIYLDPFPRPAKYSHAAAFGIRSSSRLAHRTPVSVLVTNFNRTGLDHGELETLVHEFGHVMHGVLSNTDYASQAGTSVERDFVEAPSQMFEEWARRKESLSLLPQFCNPACPAVDDDLLGRLSTARLYGAGMRYSRQHLYAAYDMATSGAASTDPLALWDTMEGETPLGHVPGTQFPGYFEHIISGYAAGYYGYMWSEVLALDMLSVYGNNLMDPVVGRRFRRTILAQGSQKKAAQMVHEFLGREPSNAAFLAEITGTRTATQPSH